MKYYYVYMLCNKRNGTLYIGVTSDLITRVSQHKDKLVEGFTNEHGLDKLVWYETHRDINQATQREKLIKKWKRNWTLELVDKLNPLWEDLFYKLV